MPNIVEGLLAANEKSRQHIAECEKIKESGHGGPGIDLIIEITKALIASTETAIGSGDVIEMLQAAANHGIGSEEGNTG